MGYGSSIGEFAGQAAGDMAARANDAKIQQMLDAMRERWENLPDAEKVQYAPVLRSALNDVKQDPRYENASNDVLSRLMQLATDGGMSPADKAKLEQSKLEALDYERGARGHTEQEMMRRGQGGSGALLSAQIAAQQGGIDRAYQGDLATAAASSDRALQALNAGGDMAMALGTRDLNMKQAAAGANDAISRFNASRADSEELYNSSLDQKNAIARNTGLDRSTGLDMSNEATLADRQRKRWRGYGKAGGTMVDSFSSGGGDDTESDWGA